MNQKIAKRFMMLAIEQAVKGKGKTGPNPLVGCVIVKDNKVIAKGFHKIFGGPHAEIIALKSAGTRAKDSTAFVSLEPCSHHGKTPPCTDAIIKAGIKEVFCASLDPNPLNNGRGIAALKTAGVHVQNGLLRQRAEKQNQDFIRRMKSLKPVVSLKLAQSIDGKIATKTGDSKWISSAKSREFVQGLRKRHDAIMVGINTVLRDDPLLTIRYTLNAKRYKKRQPVKIIVDSKLRTPLTAKLFSIKSPGKTIIAATRMAPFSRERALREKGAEIIRAGSGRKGVDLKILAQKLLQKGISSILVEGGAEVAANMLYSGLVTKVYFFICPIIIGGKDAVASIGGRGMSTIRKSIQLSNIRTKRIDKDFLVEADVYRNN